MNFRFVRCLVVLYFYCFMHTGFALECYTCEPFDPYCENPRTITCNDLEVCYEIRVRKTGIVKGCTRRTQKLRERGYCEVYDESIGPLIRYCRVCDKKDLCNNLLRGGAIGMQFFYSLLVAGILICVLFAS